MTEEIRSIIERNALEFQSYKYDYFQIFKLFMQLVFGLKFSLLNRTDKLICSELIDYTYIASGVKRKHYKDIGNVTPAMLIELYDLYKI